LYELYKLNHQIQINILNEIKKESIGRLVLKAYIEINAISKEFIKYENLGNYLDGNKKQSRKTFAANNDLLEISPIVLFQLKDFVIKELDIRFNSYYNYINLIDNRYDLINSKNILKTLIFTNVHKNTLWWHTLINLLDEKDIEIYNTYKNEFNKKNLLKNEKEKELKKYLKDSKILEKNIEIFFCIMYESGADLKTDNLKNKFYFGKINDTSSFRRNFICCQG
jgi:vacuolar-type H+-ATPase subunit I/STV1